MVSRPGRRSGQKGGIAAPAPADLHLRPVDGGGEVGEEGGEIGRGLAGTDDAEIESDGLGVAGTRLDRLDQGEEAVERAVVAQIGQGGELGRQIRRREERHGDGGIRIAILHGVDGGGRTCPPRASPAANCRRSN